MLVRNHEIGKETAQGATVLIIAFAKGNPVPFFFAGVFFSDVAMYMGSVFKHPLSALRTQTLLSAVDDWLVTFGVASDLVLCYNGHGCKTSPGAGYFGRY